MLVNKVEYGITEIGNLRLTIECKTRDFLTPVVQLIILTWCKYCMQRVPPCYLNIPLPSIHSAFPLLLHRNVQARQLLASYNTYAYYSFIRDKIRIKIFRGRSFWSIMLLSIVKDFRWNSRVNTSGWKCNRHGFDLWQNWRLFLLRMDSVSVPLFLLFC